MKTSGFAEHAQLDHMIECIPTYFCVWRAFAMTSSVPTVFL